jgi:hypothetical protein
LLLLAVLTGIAAGALTFLSGKSVPDAVVAGSGAAGAALIFFSEVVGA